MTPCATYTDAYTTSRKMFEKNVKRFGDIVGESRDKSIWYIKWKGTKYPESVSKNFIFAFDQDTKQEIHCLPERQKMNYPEIHNMVADMRISDKEDLAFQSAVIILYGVTNDTVSKNKIKKATGYFSSTIDFIFHNLHANEIIKEYQWNIGDISDPETGFMELVLCSMAGAGDIVRSDEAGKLPDVDEKPIAWKDLYRSEYPAKKIELIVEKEEIEPDFIIHVPLPETIKLLPEKAESIQATLNSIFFFDDLKKATKESAPIKLKIIPPPIKKKKGRPKRELSELQKASKDRYANINRLQPANDFTKMFQKEPSKEEKQPVRRYKELPVVPDKKVTIVRPPAVYSNSSPYGIADELLRGK